MVTVSVSNSPILRSARTFAANPMRAPTPNALSSIS